MGKAGAGTMTMTYERFETLADAYGGDLRRWPEAEREAGRALLNADPRAAAVLAVQTVLLWLSARNPADAALATASAAVFVAFSVLLLWFTALMLRLYGRLRTPLPPRRGWRHRG